MNADIHRLLDEAFAGIEMTPDAQDLKEEVRANLVARTAELEAAGTILGGCRAPGDRRARRRARAARRRDGADAPLAKDSYAAMQLRHRVRPKPGFVVRVVVWSLGLHRGDDARDSRSDRRAAAARRARSSG